MDTTKCPCLADHSSVQTCGLHSIHNLFLANNDSRLKHVLLIGSNTLLPQTLLRESWSRVASGCIRRLSPTNPRPSQADERFLPGRERFAQGPYFSSRCLHEGLGRNGFPTFPALSALRHQEKFARACPATRATPGGHRHRLSGQTECSCCRSSSTAGSSTPGAQGESRAILNLPENALAPTRPGIADPHPLQSVPGRLRAGLSSGSVKPHRGDEPPPGSSRRTPAQGAPTSLPHQLQGSSDYMPHQPMCRALGHKPSHCNGTAPCAIWWWMSSHLRWRQGTDLAVLIAACVIAHCPAIGWCASAPPPPGGPESARHLHYAGRSSRAA